MNENTTTTLIQFEFIAKGEVVKCNLSEYLPAIRARIAQFNMSPRTDDEFGQAVDDVKLIQSARDALKAGKERALADAEKLHAVFQQIDEADKELLSAKSALEKQITDRREEIKAEMVRGALGQLLCDPSMRAGYQAAIAAAMKSKRTIESMRDAVRAAVAVANDAISRSRAMLDEFIAANGPELVMDRRRMETTAPAEVSAELRRRLEARDAEREKARLRDEAEKARKEAQAAREAAARANVPETAPTAPRATQKPNPADVQDLPWDATPPTRVDQAEADELAEFLALVLRQFRPIKEARTLLRFEPNRMAANALAGAVNGWYQSNKKGLGK